MHVHGETDVLSSHRRFRQNKVAVQVQEYLYVCSVTVVAITSETIISTSQCFRDNYSCLSRHVSLSLQEVKVVEFSE